MSLPWPAAQLDELKRLYATGLSASKIAQAINTKFRAGYSRNAVIGQINRRIDKAERFQKPSAPAKLKAPPVKRAPHQNAGIAFGTRKRPPLPKGSGFVLPTYAGPARNPVEKMMLSAKANAAARAQPPEPPRDPASTTGRPWLTRAFGECAFVVSGEGADVFACCAPARPSNDWCYCPNHAQRMFAKPATQAQRDAAARARQAKGRAMKARAA